MPSSWPLPVILVPGVGPPSPRSVTSGRAFARRCCGMLVALAIVVLAQLFLVACFAAGMVAACLVFIAYGPVPVRRKVTMVPRLMPRDPFADQPAAKIVSLP